MTGKLSLSLLRNSCKTECGAKPILASFVVRAAPFALLLLSTAAFAHHAYTAEFDTTKPVKLTGVLTKVEWSNPHIWLYLDVKDENGKITNWGFSASPPGMLTRRGITKSSLKLGEVLTISGHRAKDGSNNSSGNIVTFADGRDALIGQDQALRPTELAK